MDVDAGVENGVLGASDQEEAGEEAGQIDWVALLRSVRSERLHSPACRSCWSRER